jgi:hypothetical protein
VILNQEPKKGGNLWLEFGFPDDVPNMLFQLIVKIFLEMVGFFDCEHS